jgi:hypothetical protein
VGWTSRSACRTTVLMPGMLSPLVTIGCDLSSMTGQHDVLKLHGMSLGYGQLSLPLRHLSRPLNAADPGDVPDTAPLPAGR